ncbi:MAG: hypothetical protein II876_01970, partial [Synergistaceae bacterium]|nr:hypothetical protein [Synergistaceae bacterium]
NLDGVRNLCRSVRDLWPERKFAVVYAAMKDKDYAGNLAEINATLRPKLYATCVPEMSRSASPDDLLDAAGKFEWGNVPGGFATPDEGVRKAIDDGNDSVLICGSLYMIGWVKRNCRL